VADAASSDPRFSCLRPQSSILDSRLIDVEAGRRCRVLGFDFRKLKSIGSSEKNSAFKVSLHFEAIGYARS